MNWNVLNPGDLQAIQIQPTDLANLLLEDASKASAYLFIFFVVILVFIHLQGCICSNGDETSSIRAQSELQLIYQHGDMVFLMSNTINKELNVSFTKANMSYY